MQKSEFEAIAARLNEVLYSPDFKAKSLTREDAASFMRACLYVNEGADDDFSMDAPGVQTRGALLTVAVSLEDAFRGPLNPEISGSIPDDVIREVIQVGLDVSLKIFEHADIRNLTKYFDPKPDMKFEHIPQMLNSCKVFFEMMRNTNKDDWTSLSAMLSYDKRAKIIGGILVTAKALYGEKGYDTAKIDSVLDDLFRFKYESYVGKVTNEGMLGMIDRCVAGLDEASVVLAPKKNLN